MQEKYEKNAHQFWVVDPELEVHVEGKLGRCERTYFSNGKLHSSAYRKKTILHGPSFYYASSGQVLCQTWYFEGTKIGKAHRFYLMGQLYSVERFFNGMMHLAQEYYYADGSLKTLIHYNKGRLHGEGQLFWPNGMLKRRVLYSDGKKESDQFYPEQESPIPLKSGS